MKQARLTVIVVRYDRPIMRRVESISVLAGLQAMVFIGCSRQAPVVGAAPQADWAALDPVVADAAREQLETIKQQPGAALPRAALGMIYHANAMPDLAVESYQQALQLSDESPTWWYYLAHCHAELGDYHRALTALDEVDRREDSFAASAWWRGYWLLELNRTDEASIAFARAAQLQPTALPVRVGMVRIHISRSEFDRAIAQLQAIIREHPRLGYAHQLLGTAYRSMGRFQDARQELLRSDGLRPAWDDPWLSQLTVHALSLPRQMARVDLLIESGQNDAALSLLRELEARRPNDVSVLGKIGELYIAQNETTSARAVLERALKINPDFFPVHLYLSSVHQQRGDLGKAMQHAERAIELNPTFGEAHRRKAQVCTALKDWPGATTSLEHAVRYGMNDEGSMINLGRLYASSARWNEAAHTLQIACQRYPENGDGWYALARAAAELGQIDAASSALEQALRLKPQSEEARVVIDRIAQIRSRGGVP